MSDIFFCFSIGEEMGGGGALDQQPNSDRMGSDSEESSLSMLSSTPPRRLYTVMIIFTRSLILQIMHIFVIRYNQCRKGLN